MSASGTPALPRQTPTWPWTKSLVLGCLFQRLCAAVLQDGSHVGVHDVAVIRQGVPGDVGVHLVYLGAVSLVGVLDVLWDLNLHDLALSGRCLSNLLRQGLLGLTLNLRALVGTEATAVHILSDGA